MYSFHPYRVICHHATSSLSYEIGISLAFDKATGCCQKRFICCSFSMNIDLSQVPFVLPHHHDLTSPLILFLTMSQNDLAPEGARLQSHSRNSSSTHTKQSRRSGRSSKPLPHKVNLPNQISQEVEQSVAFAAPTQPAQPPTPSSAPAKRRTSKLGEGRFSSTDFEAFLRERGCDKIPNAYDLRTLWSASSDPPITRATLSELDLQKLYDGLYLRHDLNFDRLIQFSPRSPYDTVGKQKRLEAQRYWDAVEIELALYESYLESVGLNLLPGSLLDERYSLPAPRTLDQVPWRLNQMIQAICQIVKTLVRPTKWSAVETRLDHEDFMHRLEHGQCDIEHLFKWVGMLLLESCAPSRDAKIDCMIRTISQGCRNKDSHILRRGLQDLFSIFEIMKLVGVLASLFKLIRRG